MTIREQFRQMRAAEFRRDLYADVEFYGTVRADGSALWTLFDTQRLVERVIRPDAERAALLLRSERDLRRAAQSIAYRIDRRICDEVYGAFLAKAQ